MTRKRVAARTVEGKRHFPTYAELLRRDKVHVAAFKRLKQADAHSKSIKKMPGRLVEGLNHLALEVVEIIGDVEKRV